MINIEMITMDVQFSSDVSRGEATHTRGYSFIQHIPSSTTYMYIKDFTPLAACAVK